MMLTTTLLRDNDIPFVKVSFCLVVKFGAALMSCLTLQRFSKMLKNLVQGLFPDAARKCLLHHKTVMGMTTLLHGNGILYIMMLTIMC